MIKIISIQTEFNVALFSDDVRAECEKIGLGYQAIEIACDLPIGAIGRFARAEAPNPIMNNWLDVCNALDLDPRKYIVLKDKR